MADGLRIASDLCPHCGEKDDSRELVGIGRTARKNIPVVVCPRCDGPRCARSREYT